MSAEDVKKWSGRPKPGMPIPTLPDDIRDEFLGLKGIDWTSSYIDGCEWDARKRELTTATGVAYDQIKLHTSKLCAHLGITLEEGGERRKQREANDLYQAQLEYAERSHRASRRPFADRDAAE